MYRLLFYPLRLLHAVPRENFSNCGREWKSRTLNRTCNDDTLTRISLIKFANLINDLCEEIDMRFEPFELERYFAKYEFSAKYLLSSSDCDGLLQSDVLDLADAQTRELWDNLTLGYTESGGHPLLKDEIAKMYHDITPEDVLTVVPEEGIYLTLNCILTSGDHVICTFPGYQSLYGIAEGIGYEVTKWELDETKDWALDLEFFKSQIKSNTKLLVVNFPHNPTGYTPSVDEFREIMAIAREHNIYVLSDEMYRYMEFDAADRLPSACEVYENAVSLFGVSKALGLAGLRVGWVTTKNKELLARMVTYKDFTTICGSAPSEILALIGLRSRDLIIARNLDTIKTNLALLDAFFEDSDRFSWVKPRAGSIAFPRINSGQSALTFCENLVAETGIMLLPSSVYGFGDSHFRLGFGRMNMPEVV